MEFLRENNGNETAHPNSPYPATNSSSTAQIILGAAALPNTPSYFYAKLFPARNNQIVTL